MKRNGYHAQSRSRCERRWSVDGGTFAKTAANDATARGVRELDHISEPSNPDIFSADGDPVHCRRSRSDLAENPVPVVEPMMECTCNIDIASVLRDQLVTSAVSRSSAARGQIYSPGYHMRFCPSGSGSRLQLQRTLDGHL